MYPANQERTGNQTAVRIEWCKKHALDGLRLLSKEPITGISPADAFCGLPDTHLQHL